MEDYKWVVGAYVSQKRLAAIFDGDNDITENVLHVAKKMGVSEEDLVRYGATSANCEAETDLEKIKRLLGAE